MQAVSEDYNGGASNPFGEAQSDDDQSVEDDPATDRGVAVKAIYDYVKTEDDEFSFKTGMYSLPCSPVKPCLSRNPANADDLVLIYIYMYDP